ncbi:MAG TPA: PLD nuclease N-terminal domain-containing protein [Propionibacteriaceae bacterium]|nr:PLD nuclease N-terminal domain-containing protein [Propionibacteriaceae bacterium]
MGRVVIAVVVIGLGVYAFVQALQTDATQIRFMPRWLWIAVILAFPVIGPGAWIVAGRESLSATGQEHRPLGPDDDPDFLRRLK